MNEVDAIARTHGYVAIVDDDGDFADSLAALLHSAGIACLPFADVPRLLQALDHTRILAVLLDVRMPILGGSAAIRAILDIAPALRIVSITAHVDAEDRASLYAAGTRAVLVKPFGLADVLRTLDAV